MRAWRLKSANNLKLETLEPVSPTDDFIKLKVTFVGLSKQDVNMYSGDLVTNDLPITIGRQAVGMVTEVGDAVKSVSRGDRVVLDSYIDCVDCDECRDGRYTDCIDLKMYGVHGHGFMSDFVIAREGDVFKLPDMVKDEEAIFVSHIAFASNILSKLNIQKGEYLVISGATVVGVILAQLALYHQVVPILIDTRHDRLNLAEKLGIYYTINSVKDDTKKRIFSLTGGAMASTAAYFPTADTPVAKCLDYVSNGGRVAICDWQGNANRLSGAFDAILAKQLTVIGVSNGAKLIPTAINMLATKTISVQTAITSIVSFDDVEKEIKEQIKHPDKDIKVLVKV